jgi:hypothetical protein
VTDTELVYALYVQANPVINPDLLPLTQFEAELLTHERSTDMDTREHIDNRRTPRLPRRRALAFGLGAILVVAAVATAAVLIVAGDGDDPVAAADAAPTVTFDGNSCRYDGPTLIEEGVVTITAVNTGTEMFDLAGFLMPESRLAAELERTPLGTDMALTPIDPMPSGNMATVTARPGSEGVGLWTMREGMYIIDCVTYFSGYSDHVWRAATTVEVVAP